MKDKLPVWKCVVVLIGFPAVSTLLSLLLLKRDIFQFISNDFFTIFWIIITAWYIAQWLIIKRLLASSNLQWKDIGYTYTRKQTFRFICAYLFVGFGLLALIEFALKSVPSDPDMLKAMSDLSNITPQNTRNRIIFIFMGLTAGITEELVYRGFAISALKNFGINKWLAVVIAAIPFVFQHGLKSIDQFGWFFTWGIIFGIMFNLRKRLDINIILHWLVILAGLIAILQVLP